MRAYQLDARDFIRRSVGEVYEQPFAAYTPPLSNREKKAADRARREQRASTEPVPCEPPLRFVDHFVMNLPATALEFIDAYRGLYDDLLDRHGDAFLVPARARPTPLVHCYCFSKAEDAEGAEREICEVRDHSRRHGPADNPVRQRATAALGQPVSRELNDFALSYVRSVAPRKTMYRLSFRLPWAVLASHRPDLAAS
jgi:tRNA (guanine37-N1)-methyltransferase